MKKYDEGYTQAGDNLHSWRRKKGTMPGWTEWRTVQTYDPIRSPDPRNSVAHRFELDPARHTPGNLRSFCGREAEWRRTAPAKGSAKKCSRCMKALGKKLVAQHAGGGA